MSSAGGGGSSGLNVPDPVEMAGWNPEEDQQGGKTFMSIEGGDGQKAEYLLKRFNPWAFGQLVPLINIVIIILGWLSLSLEVFLRHRFGERYFTPSRFVLALITFSFLATGGQAGALWGSGEGFLSDLSILFTLSFYDTAYRVFIIASLIHLLQIWLRSQQGEEWYSYSFGVSWFAPFIGIGYGPWKMPEKSVLLQTLIGKEFPRIEIDDWALYRIIEPVLMFGLSYVVLPLSVSVSWWFWVAAIALFIKNNYMYAQERSVVLNMRDASLRQRFYEASSRGEPKQKTGGVSVVRLPRALDRNRDGIPDQWQSQPASTATSGTAISRTATSGGRPDFSDVVGQPIAPSQSPPITAPTIPPQVVPSQVVPIPDPQPATSGKSVLKRIAPRHTSNQTSSVDDTTDGKE